MKRDSLRLSPTMSVETGLDWNGRYWIAYSSGASVFVRDVAELRRFLKAPKGIPMRESLESWLASLADMDAARGKAPEPVGDANVEGSWDPQAHDVDNDNTRMIT
jgi:hypothetical protein